MQFLIIRRDNIGDLVCTTPLLTALRARYPNAWIGVLANAYNAPALQHNPDIDEIFAYQKRKHLPATDSVTQPKWVTRLPFVLLAQATLARIAIMWRLRQRHIDTVILAAGSNDQHGRRFARWIAPQHIVSADAIAPGQHEVERVHSAARALAVQGAIPALTTVATAQATDAARAAFNHLTTSSNTASPVIGIHISARRLKQRWPAQQWIDLIHTLHLAHRARLLLLWSPGATDHPQHPGDDALAAHILSHSKTVSIVGLPTTDLGALIGALDVCDLLVCSDGGAMHLAAGLHVPLVCLFGDSPVARWRPWASPHQVLAAPSGVVSELEVATVAQAVQAQLPKQFKPA